VLPDPGDVCVKSVSELVGALLKPGGVIKEDEIELSEFFRDTLVLNKPVDDWRKALVQRGCERNLFPQIRSRKSAGWI
jgi:hypothetical protein